MKNKIYLILAALLITFILTNPGKEDIVSQLNRGTYTEDTIYNPPHPNLFHWHDIYDNNPERANYGFFSVFKIKYYEERIGVDSIKYPRTRYLIKEEHYLGICWKCYRLGN